MRQRGGQRWGHVPRSHDNVAAARELRQRLTPAEALLWEALRERRLGGIKFRRQHPVGAYVLDFCCSSLRLGVEVDGGVHDGRQEEDAARAAVLAKEGYVRGRGGGGGSGRRPGIHPSGMRSARRTALTPPAPLPLRQARGPGGEGHRPPPPDALRCHVPSAARPTPRPEAPLTPPPLLDVRDLHLHYSAEGRVVRAVDGVSFAIAERGEAIAVVGESGSGKSSLANALMRLLPKNVARFDGSITLGGLELTALSDEEYRRQIRWRRIAMVFQGAMNVLNPVLRVGDQIAEPLLLDPHADKRAARRRAEELLERVGLAAAYYPRYPHELSGGQKQRVVIATALVLDPDLLILDEPTSALDVSVQAQIMDLLKDLKEDPGISMLFITHDIGLASDLCDRIAVAYAGEHAELGPAERVLVAPRHPYSQLLLASLPRLRSAVRPRPMPGDPPDPTNLPTGCRFHPRCPYRFDPCPTRHPPSIPLPDGGHARCWLNDPAVAGDRFEGHLREGTTADG